MLCDSHSKDQDENVSNANGGSNDNGMVAEEMGKTAAMTITIGMELGSSSRLSYITAATGL